MRVRLRHIKVQKMVFLSHLDVTVTINRALRRARIPFSLTEGFNPKAKVSYGQPLGVGMGSLAEYFDLYLAQSVQPGELTRRINNSIHPQLRVLAAREVDMRGPSLMARLAYADYYVQISAGVRAHEFVPAIFEEKAWQITREKGSRVDLRPLIKRFKWLGFVGKRNDRRGLFWLRAKTGSKENMRPGDFCTLLQTHLGAYFHGACWVLRRDLYFEEGEKLLTPFGMEVKN